MQSFNTYRMAIHLRRGKRGSPIDSRKIRTRYLLGPRGSLSAICSPVCFDRLVFEGRSSSWFIPPIPTTCSLVPRSPFWRGIQTPFPPIHHASRRVVIEDRSTIHRRPFDHSMALNGSNVSLREKRTSRTTADLPCFAIRGIGASGDRGLTHLGGSTARGVLRKSHVCFCPSAEYPADISSHPGISLHQVHNCFRNVEVNRE